MIKWIDVQKQLPEKMKKILFVWTNGGNKNIAMGYLCNEGWDIYLPYHSFKMCPDALHVTHWSELPDFP